MKLQKRDCPLDIRVFPRGAGWTDITWFVPDKMSEPLVFTASDIGCSIGGFACALYYMNPSRYECGHASNIIECVDYQYNLDVERYEIYRYGEKHPPGMLTEFPIIARFHWDEEPGGSQWTLSREPPDKPNNDIEFTVHMHIALSRYRGGQFSREFDYAIEFDYEFLYSDLCYAVGKAITDIVKRYGLYGFYHSTHDRVELVHLIALKAVALGCNELCDLEYLKCGNGEASDFTYETELLLFDM